MSTLGGIFGAQPRCKRNFLLENIRDIRKERLKKKAGNLDLEKVGQCGRKVPQLFPKLNTHQTTQLKGSKKSTSPSKSKKPAPPNLQRQTSSAPKCHPENGSHTSCKPHSLFRQKEGVDPRNCSREDDTTCFKYIDEENVPFRWTQVCPSVISHTVCHQSVQTLNEDDLDSLLEDGSIKYPSSDKAPGDVKECSLPVLEWPTYADEENSLLSGRENTTESNPSLKKSFGFASTSPVDLHRSPDQQSTNALADKRSSVQQTSRKQTADLSDSIEMPPPAHYPFSSKTNGEEVSRRYRPQNKIENLEITSVKTNGQASKLPMGYQRGVIPKYLAKRINEQKSISRTKESNEVISPDKERRIAIQEATQEFDSLIAELNKMPVRTDTLRTKQRKIEIERQLDALERRLRALTRISDLQF